MHLEFLDNTEPGGLNYTEESRIKILNKRKQWSKIKDENEHTQVQIILMRKQEAQKWRV